MSGYEKGITSKWLRMVLHNEYPIALPGFPKTPDQPGRSTPNHQLLAHLARVTWAIGNGGSETVLQRELDWAIEFFEHQQINGFMTRAKANEQLSPSHSQWWITGVLGFHWLFSPCRKDSATAPSVSECILMHRQPGDVVTRIARLYNLTGWWLRSHHSLCKLFVAPPARRGQAPRIICPGARAWPRNPNKKYNGRSSARDELYYAIEQGRIRKTWDPEKSKDMAGLYFADLLLKSGDDLGGAKQATAKDVPLLKWPIRYLKTGRYFWAYLDSIEDAGGLETQRFAAYIDDHEAYILDQDFQDRLPIWPTLQGTPKVLGAKAK